MEEKFSPSQACAAFAAGLRYEDIPDKVLDLIKRDLLDWAGCAIKGSRDRSSQPIRNVKALLGGAPQAGVFGDPALTDMRTAATENGYFGHIFEMDDVDRESISHPATVVMPPALAAAQYLGRSGRDILTAIVAGFEVMLRIGAAITPAHYKIFHTTSTTGVFGAAASAGRILGLAPERMLWALGNAGTLACGLWQFNPDGAMSKFIHAGGAAGNGLWVALLAQNGFSGASHILEGPQGFFAGFARQEVNMDLFRDFGKRWRAGTVSFKPYPCCRHTHSAIDAALEIRRQLLQQPGDRIARLTARTYGTALSIAGKTRPKTGRDAKFSLSYCIASAILRGTPAEASFSQQATEDPELRAADLAFGNLEGTLLEGGETLKTPSPTTYAFRTPVRYARYLKEAGFDFLSLANNHAGDFGEEGMDSTQRCLRSQDIAFAGIRGVCEYTLIERGGVRFGVAAFGHNFYTPRHGDEAEVRRILSELRRRADLIVVSFHGGAEGRDRSRLPYGEEVFLNEKRGSLRRFAHLCVDLGADAVFGHGPHVPRAVEVYKDRFIAYSLGNFCTPYMVSLKGISGLAPVIEIRIDRSGRFLSGRIHSFRQIRGVGPRLDPERGAARLIKALSEEDIRDRAFTIDEEGRILPGAATAPKPAPSAEPQRPPEAPAAAGAPGESAEPEDPRVGEDILIEEPAEADRPAP